MLPNFLGIGVQRAATTWLHQCLAGHPDVCMPHKKEVHYFDANLDKGLAWYEEQFAHYAGEKAVGEITPRYLHDAPLDQISQLLPDAKLILILREPVSRAYSAYRLMNETFGNTSFQQVCESVDRGNLIRRSQYADKIEELFTYYDRDQTLILLFDDVQTKPAEVFHQVCDHLGVARLDAPEEVTKIYNHIVFPKLQDSLRKYGMGWTINLVKQTPFAEAIKRQSKLRQEKTLKAEKEADKVYLETLRKKFSEDVDRTEALIGRDLSMWKSSK